MNALPLAALLLLQTASTQAPVRHPESRDPKGAIGAVGIGAKPGDLAATSTPTSNGAATPATASAPGQLFVGGSDDCATPEVIVGNGPFPFDNSAATTGAEGQNEALCNFYTIRGITNDVWFEWTAPASGTATLSLCAGTSGLDTKVAVYDGSGCPAGSAIACNDDSCGFVSRVLFCASGGQVYTVQLGNYPSAIGGTGSFTIQLTPPGVGNDDCSTPTVLAAGTGPWAFDNSAATTGCQGQGNTSCNQFGTPGIHSDLWYSWTAPASGLARATTCSQTNVDTKIAVYAGAGCPSAQAIACIDDACGLQTAVCFGATAGTTYTVQLGTFPGAAGGAGTFDITIAPPLQPCQYDDGSSENLLGWVAGGELVWMQRFGTAGGSTSLDSVRVSWGSPSAPGAGPGNGSPATVAVWDDPNDDGDPGDLVLVQQVATSVANVDTDLMNTVPVTPVVLQGVFFVGAGLSHSAGQFVAPMDQSCPTPGVAWFFGNNNGTPVDYANVGNNAQPPLRFDAAGYPTHLMLRAGCSTSPLTPFCLPGQGGTVACPCGNPPAGGGLGCDNFGAGPAESGTLGASGVASLAADSVILEASGENATSFTVLWQGKDPVNPAGIFHGAGVRCVTAGLKRLYFGSAVGGVITRPRVGDPSVSARSAAVGDPISAGQARHYFTIYRDPNAAGPCGIPTSTINVTNAGTIPWGP